MASNTRTMSFGSFLVLLFVVDLFDVAIGDVTKRTNERCDKICQEESARVAQVGEENFHIYSTSIIGPSLPESSVGLLEGLSLL